MAASCIDRPVFLFFSLTVLCVSCSFRTNGEVDPSFFIIVYTIFFFRIHCTLSEITRNVIKKNVITNLLSPLALAYNDQ